jgi:hypothetical protein
MPPARRTVESASDVPVVPFWFSQEFKRGTDVLEADEFSPDSDARIAPGGSETMPAASTRGSDGLGTPSLPMRGVLIFFYSVGRYNIGIRRMDMSSMGSNNNTRGDSRIRKIDLSSIGSNNSRGAKMDLCGISNNNSRGTTMDLGSIDLNNTHDAGNNSQSRSGISRMCEGTGTKMDLNSIDINNTRGTGCSRNRKMDLNSVSNNTNGTILCAASPWFSSRPQAGSTFCL